MPSGVVLVIEDDEWVGRLLATAIREAGYEVVLCDTAEAGLSRACASEPECIVCDIDLPDHDGYWVARNLRTHPSRVSVTPFLFLSGLDDAESRLEGFHVGADVYMTKPFRVGEVVSQIGALVQMASRLRQRRESLLSIPAPAAGETAIEGDISQMSIATVLTVIEMERRSGVFEVISKKRRAQLDISGGGILHGTVGGTRVSALAALRTMLTWKLGRFAFSPSPRSEQAEQKSIAAYLLEATRLEDESARAELQLPPSRRRLEPRIATTALGGPASIPDDVAPPSSRASTQRRPRRRTSVAPGKPTEGVVSISDAPPSIDVIFDFDSGPPSGSPGTPPTLRSLARVTKPPSSRRGPAFEPSPAPQPPARSAPPAPPRRATVPPPPMPGARAGAPAPGALSRPAAQPLQGAPRPGAGPLPPRPTPARPPRPDTTKKR